MSQLSTTRPGSRLPRGLLLLALFLLWPAATARADEIALWNFNDGDLTRDRGNTGTLTTTVANFTFFSGTTVNQQMGDPAGLSLALQGGTNNANNGANLTLAVSTVGFTSIRVSFATQGTDTGFNSNQFQYSLDGVNFVDFGAPFDPPTAFAFVSFDLSAVTGLNGNPNAAFRIVFNGSTTGTSNNRIDNLVVTGTAAEPTPEPVPEPATILLFGTGMAGTAAVARRRRRTRDGTKV